MKIAKSCSAAAAAAAIAIAALSACSPTRTHESAGEYVDDATITTKVKTALAEDPQTKATQINVKTYRGEVQLSGFVDSSAEARRAEEVARQVKGVKQVKDDTEVKPPR